MLAHGEDTSIRIVSMSPGIFIYGLCGVLNKNDRNSNRNEICIRYRIPAEEQFGEILAG